MTASEIEAAMRAASADTAPLRARIAELEAALRELAGEDLYLRHASSWHDSGSLTDGVRNLARNALDK